METLTAFMNSADDEVAKRHIPIWARHNQLIDPERTVAVAQEIFDAWVDPRSRLSISHDLYLKAWQLTKPDLGRTYGILLFDEAQDANPVLLAIAGPSNIQLQRIFVGDPHQSIYAWRNAENALETINLESMALTQSFRFGERVAQVANLVLNAKGVDPSLYLHGNPEIASTIGPIAVPDVVLTRTNIGMFTEALDVTRGLKVGERIAFLGGYDSIYRLINGACDLYSGKRPPGNSDLRFFDTWADLVQASAEPDGRQYKPYIKLVETHGKRLPEIAERLRTYVVEDEREAKTLFSTAHGFKGREKAQVRLGGDFWSFIKKEKTPNSKTTMALDAQEANITYVAMTRAQQRLDGGEYFRVLKTDLSEWQEYRRERAAAQMLRAGTRPTQSAQALSR
jgi:hypothetical protein